jgi:Glycosyl-transferase for dystroglycan
MKGSANSKEAAAAAAAAVADALCGKTTSVSYPGKSSSSRLYHLRVIRLLHLLSVVMMAMLVLQSFMQSLMHFPKGYLTIEPAVITPVINAQSDSSSAAVAISENSKPHDFQQFFEAAPSCSIPIVPDQVSFTLFTHSSFDRLWQIEHHCARWTGKISLAVYIGTLPAQEQATMTAESVKIDLVQRYRCGVDQLSVQVVGGFSEQEYPTNVMRNTALQGVTTSHVIFLDMDFWFPLHLEAHLQSFASALAADDKLSLVLPAFTLSPQRCKRRNRGNKTFEECFRRTNVAFMPNTKPDLLRLWKPRRNQQRADAFFGAGHPSHSSTRYDEWIAQPENQLLPIDCLHSWLYEPYLVVRYCREMPPFQEAFTGYGRNKVSWMTHTRRLGHKYQQTGGAFVIHFPHAFSKARLHFEGNSEEMASIAQGQSVTKRWRSRRRFQRAQQCQNTTKRSPEKQVQVDKLYLDFLQWLNDTVPMDATMPMCEGAVETHSGAELVTA